MIIEFVARVNGARRSVWIAAHSLPEWVTEGLEPGMIPYLTDETLDEIEMFVMNDEGTYRTFYAGADDDDYDAELTDRYVRVVDDY